MSYRRWIAGAALESGNEMSDAADMRRSVATVSGGPEWNHDV